MPITTDKKWISFFKMFYLAVVIVMPDMIVPNLSPYSIISIKINKYIYLWKTSFFIYCDGILLSADRHRQSHGILSSMWIEHTSLPFRRNTYTNLLLVRCTRTATQLLIEIRFSENNKNIWFVIQYTFIMFYSFSSRLIYYFFKKILFGCE